jgi:predicted NBD/HSP70 family sugar kinase
MRNKPSVQTALLGSIILHLRSQRANSRSTLSKISGLSPSTVGLYVDQLLSASWLTETGLEQGVMGRPKRKLSLRADAGWFAGIEFNAERLRAVCVDFAGAPKNAIVTRLPAKVDTRSVIKEIKNAIAELAKKAEGPLCAVGVGAPGIIDPVAGRAVFYSFIPDWRNVPLVAEVQRRFHTKVILENNLRAIALAERWFGGGRELDDYVVLGPRSGFGMAIVKNGKLVNGAHHAAGEIGCWPWPNGSQQKALHDSLSAPAVWSRLSSSSTKSKLPSDLYEALSVYRESSSKEWQSVVDDYVNLLELLQWLLDSHTYFLHGPQTALGERFCQAIVEKLKRRVPTFRDSMLQLVPSTLGDDAGALGAASLAMEGWVPER